MKILQKRRHEYSILHKNVTFSISDGKLIVTHWDNSSSLVTVTLATCSISAKGTG